MKKYFCDVCGKEVDEKNLRKISIPNEMVDERAGLKLNEIEGCSECIEFIRSKSGEFNKINASVIVEFYKRLIDIRKR